ncbi:PilT/PilU family type 4a pilus ATPase [Desulfuromonas sp. AOP6]|uniref:type IV pilus twitching motility protein PilT n=1 Tax=Desulfuromonas sp. AOP6 TaxID=1566351 RepID=UPI00127F3EE7|nr:PilT/PilU family type 4a pilus ATPase [Desulfuromonas sp. AOP6]BCA80219.1 twitching motility protein PilT [Desulfuromonas sp. AOP6]
MTSEQQPRPGTPSMHQLLKAMVDQGGSDLHITTGSAPQCRIDGHMVPMKLPPMQPPETKQLCYSILTDSQKRKFEEENELDFSFGVKGLARFRGNIFLQRGAMAGVFRQIPYKIMTFEELGLPPVVRTIAHKPRGLVLVTGPTGSGKSTTLASIIDSINSERHEHIITVEDPIEYIHPHKKCVVNQREVGSDTQSFKKALKYILRQDPDVVLLGELRDLETIEAALTIAETGHLCFATLHTNSAVQSINRIVDVFPTNQQAQVRTQLSFVLEGVMSQILLPKMSGKGRALALEVMVPNMAIRALIRDDKIHQMYSQMQMGQDKFGMQTMNQSLFMLYHKKQISMEMALTRSSEPEELKQMIANPASVLKRQVPTAPGRG